VTQPRTPPRHVPMIAATPQVERALSATQRARELVGMVRSSDRRELVRNQRVAEEVDLAVKHLQEALRAAHAPEIERPKEDG
jgi:hypothetical protein